AAAVANEVIGGELEQQTFGEGGQDLTFADIGNANLVFLSALDADDQPPLGDTVTTDPTQAAFVRVTVTPHTVQMGFASALSVLLGGTRNDAQVGATSVAGFTQYACAVTPLMFCLPETGYRADDHIGDLIVLRTSRKDAAWQPGNFGFLDPTSSAIPDPNGPCAGLPTTGNKLWQCLIGAGGPLVQCYAMRGVDTEPGQRVGLAEAFNTRFDLYNATMSGERNDPAYAPAPNVIQGGANRRKGGGTCDYTDTTADATKPLPVAQQSMGLPRDDCLATGTCPGGSSRFGDGDWSDGRLAYVEANYGDGDPATPTTDPHPGATTRYEYYLAEIGAMASGRILPSPRVETGVAQCHAAPTSDPDRRVLIAAGIDCAANPFTGKASGIPVEEFFRLFVTEPASNADSETPPNIDIVAEVIGSAGSAGSYGDAIFHDVVQLYR
ncbi:hypothetical protein, partial [Rubellimicrobium roseum]|uniref:hypothetical protein n=1 Tax=Rubellimicrobium roseum TaxID=687525 RepID=UPI00159BEF4F